MPSVSAPATVLVTGSNGFLASHIVKCYIDAGFTVVGTVRREETGESLKALFPDRFSYVVVKDIQAAGALDALVTRVDVIAHTASPTSAPPGDYDPQLLIGPAVEGTRNVLKSAAIDGSTVKRVVITGSLASVIEPHDGPYEYSDKDWNDFAVHEVERIGNKAPGVIKYFASKTLAERAVIEYMSTHKPAFDLVNVMPAFVYGPIIAERKDINNLWGSLKMLINCLVNPDMDVEESVGGYVDVRDVGRAHVDATTRQDLSGARLFMAHAQAIAVQDFRDAFFAIPEEERPSLAPFTVQRGRPGAGDARRANFIRFSRESQNKLGWELRGFNETLRDTVLTF